MKRHDVKSLCPINFTVEIFGDPWSVIIMREIATFGGRTYGELLAIEERIGTSVLADRLQHLEQNGIIKKQPHTTDKRKAVYLLGESGIDALPMLYEIACFGSRTSQYPKAAREWFRAMELDREVVLAAWTHAARSGDAFFGGAESVVSRLQLDSVE
jgi:DNA-binding HxlR family transcriptional regulator